MSDCGERKRLAIKARHMAVASASVITVVIVMMAAVWFVSRWADDNRDRLPAKTAFAAGVFVAILGVVAWALEVASAVCDQEAQKEKDGETTADDEIASGVSIAAAVFVSFAAAAVVCSGMVTALPYDDTQPTTHRSRIEYYGFALFMLVAFALPLTVAAASTIRAKNC